MKYLYYIALAVLTISCGPRNIKTLSSEQVSFEDLPAQVAQYLQKPADVQKDVQSMLIVLPRGEESKYRLETVKTWTGPWVAYTELINQEDDLVYRIDRGVPSPYIVFEGSLYVPDRYNIFFAGKGLNTVKFTCYQLK